MNIERIKAVGFGITEPKGKFQLINFNRRSVGDKDILIDIMYAGICHSDIHVSRGEWGEWNDRNVIPGHEIVGLVKQIGKDVTKFKIGDIAAIGCMVDACCECENCKSGHEQYCTEGTVLTYDAVDWKHHDEITKGGYSTNYVLNEDFAIKIPKSVSDKLELIPSLCCAGITTYSPIVSANVEGKTCAVIGLGGLGHMAVKYLHSFGASEVYAFDTVSKADVEKDLDITFMIANERNIKKCFQKFDFIISTVPFDYDLGFYMSMIKKGGDIAIVGLPEWGGTKTNFSVKSLVLDYGNIKIWGSQIGGIPLTQECVDYSIKHKIFPDVEVIDPDPKEIDNAYEKVRSGKIRFRYVIDMTKLNGIEKFKNGGEVEYEYEKFLKTLPKNLSTPTDDYRMERFWELNGKPKDFEEAKSKGMFTKEEDGWHAGSVTFNEERGVYEFMKSKNHPSVHFEIEWAKNDPEFSKEWELADDPENPGFYMYKRKQQDMTLEEILNSNISDSAKAEIQKAFGIPKDLQGAQITITIESASPEEEFKASPITITVGDKSYDVRIADTEEARQIGLSRETNLPEDEGMLFVFDEETSQYFTMKDTDIDLDIIFISKEGDVIEVHSVEARDPKPVQCSTPYRYVLEVNIDSDIQPGDELDFVDDEFNEEEKETISRSRMLVLDENGDVQMKLQGGERIVSIKATRRLIKLALKAYKNDTDLDYRRVGKFILQEFVNLDNRDPQYVLAPEKKGDGNGE